MCFERLSAATSKPRIVQDEREKIHIWNLKKEVAVFASPKL